jgi:hypothetical protein
MRNKWISGLAVVAAGAAIGGVVAAGSAGAQPAGGTAPAAGLAATAPSFRVLAANPDPIVVGRPATVTVAVPVDNAGSAVWQWEVSLGSTVIASASTPNSVVFTVPVGSTGPVTVDLTISTAGGSTHTNRSFATVTQSPTTVVPSVIGFSPQSATNTLRAAGVVGTSITRLTIPCEPAEVIAQNPAGGSVVPTGSTVQITILVGRPLPPGQQCP